MNDAAIFTLMKSIIDAGLVAQGLTGVQVAQSYQTKQEGAAKGMAVYLHPITDKRYGSVQRNDVLDGDVMAHTEVQQMETGFQVDARIYNPTIALGALSANDLVNIVAQIIQSDIALSTLKAQNVGILRVTDIRQPFFINDSDRNERSPSFDFTLTHKRSLVGTVPKIDAFEANIHRV